MKVICQNCYEILANKDEAGSLRFNPNEIESIAQELNPDEVLLTLACPKCGCTVQVKV